MRHTLLFALLVGFAKLSAQDVQIPSSDTVLTAKRDTLRRYYIRSFPDHFFLYPVLKQKSLNFEIEKQDKSASLTYRPNNSYSFGLGMYLFELGFELTFAIPLNDKSISLYGESKARDLQLNVFGKKWGFDAFYQKYNGFYITEQGNTPPPSVPFPQRPDIDTRSYGLTGNYVFNNQKFSFRSAYNFAEKQLYSKGSFLLFSTINTFKLTADSSILSNSQQAVFGDKVSFATLRYTTFSVAPGYTYSLIFKSFFLNGTFSLGPAHHWIHYRLGNGTKEDDVAINTFVAARIAIGYNGNRLFGGISFLAQGSNVKFEDVRFSNSTGAFKILIGYRFHEFGFLRKRVWDLVPFTI